MISDQALIEMAVEEGSQSPTRKESTQKMERVFSLASFARSTDITEAQSFSSDETISSSSESLLSVGMKILQSPEHESFIEQNLLPKVSDGRLPQQSECTNWLKYLIGLVCTQIVLILLSSELAAAVILRLDFVRYLDFFAAKMFSDPIIILINVIGLMCTLGRSIIIDAVAFVMLLHGKRRRVLPRDSSKRLVHAVVVTQYKEPLEVLDATVSSLAESTLAHSAVVVLACEDRDPHADEVFHILEDRYGHYFRDFIKTSHKLVPGEIAGCSSNENYAARQVYKYAQREGLDPFKVMLTICDADSLFDPVYLEHVEAEFWRTPGGARAIYDAPINTYRNLKECNLLVQACEISRCQDGLFSGLQFRPAQSNYSLSLGFAKEIDFWDPSNTSEDFHTTLKAMAHTGQGQGVVVRIWSLILNDSVSSFKDRWTQAKRHMWGIEECAWTVEVFHHLRLFRWVGIFGLTIQRMLFGPNVVPIWILLLCPSVRALILALKPETLYVAIGCSLVFKLFGWIQIVLREIFMRRYILQDRKHMMPAGWKNWAMLLTVYPVMEQVAIFVFFTCATWAMLWRALRHKSIVYVVAPKALAEQKENGDIGTNNNNPVIKKSA